MVIPLFSQERPAVWGIARMTFLISDFDMARDYYGKFLGFDEAFTYDSEKGKVLVFKVNDRQFLEFIQDTAVSHKNPLVSVSLETDAEIMRMYLSSKALQVPAVLKDDGAGNKVFCITDPSGNQIEFITYNREGLHMQTKGKFLSDRRISKRIHHAGLYTHNIDAEDPFYTGILGFTLILRYPDDNTVKPSIVYFGMTDCTESIEEYSPSDIHFSHPCFLVDDMQEAIYTLKERQNTESLGRPWIGKGRRWILNITNPDGTKVEFTEAFTVK
jgi:catechol 2,3-dioxygenase-like lactoylglutathione lyase family enzyme